MPLCFRLLPFLFGVHDKIALMLILIPVLVFVLTALCLTLIRLTKPQSRLSWWLALSGALIAWSSVWLWPFHMPAGLSSAPWQPLFEGGLHWLADGYSWPYALALTTLMLSVVLTSVLHLPANLLAWAGMFALTALGLLSVTAENLLTLALVWAALDLAELVTLLHSTSGERAGDAVVAFAVRVSGIGLVAWAGARTGVLLDFTAVPSEAGFYLLLAVILRLGILPLHLPYLHEPALRRDYGSVLRLVSAASGLAVLARLPLEATSRLLIPLLVIIALMALYGGYAWMRVSDEIAGRPFWVLGMAGLAFAATVRGSPTGATAWGAALILCGGFLFLYSARHRALFWAPLLGAFSLSTLPFSVSAPGWMGSVPLPWLFWLPLLLAQAFLLSGYLRHASHSGESSLESYPRWAQVMYALGLMTFLVSALALGLWGWPGARMMGAWWVALIAILGASLATWLAGRLVYPRGVVGQWNALPPLAFLYRWSRGATAWLERLTAFVNSLLEGEGGMFWSLLLLALLASLITQL